MDFNMQENEHKPEPNLGKFDKVTDAHMFLSASLLIYAKPPRSIHPLSPSYGTSNIFIKQNK
jgi:hypothetical protein